jgi:hypothetical protein
MFQESWKEFKLEEALLLLEESKEVCCKYLEVLVIGNLKNLDFT